MTKERLEELIKQNATVVIKTYNKIIKVDTKEAEIIDDRLYLTARDWFPIKDVYFNEMELQKAEWHAKTYAERTERFEPPMWEDIEDYYFPFINQIKDGYILWRFEVIKGKCSNAGISIWNDEHELYIADATKENYEKACEIVRNLFKGESNGKNS